MRDLIISAAVLAWGYMAAHTGAMEIVGLFDNASATLAQILAGMG